AWPRAPRPRPARRAGRSSSRSRSRTTSPRRSRRTSRAPAFAARWLPSDLPPGFERQRVEQLTETPDRFRCDAVADPGPVHAAADEAGLLEDLQMLGDRGLGEREPPDDGPA